MFLGVPDMLGMSANLATPAEARLSDGSGGSWTPSGTHCTPGEHPMANTDETTRRQDLGKLVRSTRLAMSPRLTIDQAAERAPMSPVTWGNIETGKRVKPFSYAGVEHVLRWPTGSIERYLGGGEAPAPARTVSVYVEGAWMDAALRMERPDAIKVDLIWVLRSGRNPIDAVLELERDDHHKVEIIAALRELEGQVQGAPEAPRSLAQGELA